MRYFKMKTDGTVVERPFFLRALEEAENNMFSKDKHDLELLEEVNDDLTIK